MAEKHTRSAHWWRWTATTDELHEIARTAAQVVEEVASEAKVSVTVQLVDRAVDFDSIEEFTAGFGPGVLPSPLRELSISVWDKPFSSGVHTHVSVGGYGYAAYVTVDGTNRAGVDAVVARMSELMDRGRRRVNRQVQHIWRFWGTVSALLGVGVAAGIVAVTGGYDSDWWILALAGFGGVALSALGYVLGSRGARWAAPWLEVREPGELARWETLRAASIRSSERLLWLAIGAGLAVAVNLVT
jgi:hypothetical protein